MRKLLAVIALLAVCAAPAMAGSWDSAYVWNNASTQGFFNYWGMGLEGGSNWTADPPTNQTQQLAANRFGTANAAEKDILLTSGKIKWRTDKSLPAGGHTADYNTSLGICVGWKITGSPTLTCPAVYLRGANSGVRIGYTATASSVLGVNTNWIAGTTFTVVDSITGDWTQALDTWSYLKVVNHNDAAGKSWEAWLYKNNQQAGYMMGHSTGDAGNYIQYGFLSGASNQEATYDYLALGYGDANIGNAPLVATPEPGSLLALGTGLLGLVGMLRKRS